MLHGPDESSHGHKEEEDSDTNNTAHDLEAGDQSKPLSPRCNSNHQQAHHLQVK